MRNPISLSEAARITGLSRDYLRVAANRGAIPAKKIGRNWTVEKSWAVKRADKPADDTADTSTDSCQTENLTTPEV